MKIVAATLFLVALALLGYSSSMSAYKNGDSLDWMSNVPHGNSAKFYEVREASVTAKYRLQDYAVSILAVAIVLTVAATNARMLVPRSMLGFVGLAVLAPLLSCAGLVFDLIQGSFRFEYPPWADSIGIPLMGVPVLLLGGLAWSLSHLVLLRGISRQNAPLSIRAIRRGGLWLQLVAGATLVLVVWALAEGAYWLAVPGFVWLYLYSSIAAARGAHAA